MKLGYVINPYFSNHKILGCPSLCSAKTSLIINTSGLGFKVYELNISLILLGENNKGEYISR